MNVATKLRDLGGRWAGAAALYRLDPPVDHEGRDAQFAVVSASTKPPGPPEVAIFEATPEGEVENIGNPIGRLKHSTSHHQALVELGYEPSDAGEA